MTFRRDVRRERFLLIASLWVGMTLSKSLLKNKDL